MQTKICHSCKLNKPLQEIEENAKCYTYGEICNYCARKVDNEQDSQQQEK